MGRELEAVEVLRLQVVLIQCFRLLHQQAVAVAACFLELAEQTDVTEVLEAEEAQTVGLELAVLVIRQALAQAKEATVVMAIAQVTTPEAAVALVLLGLLGLQTQVLVEMAARGQRQRLLAHQ